jgi:hypothetical protein
MFSRFKILVFIVSTFLFTTSAHAQPADDPAALPLLAPGLHVGIIYSPPDDAPAIHARLDTAFGEAIQTGASVYELSISWSDLEPNPGEIDTAYLESLLDILSSVHLQPYLSITTINTVKLTLPSDLMTADEYELAQNRHFDDPVITERFARLLEAVVPLLVEHGGFFISVGNEVEGWLESRPDEAPGFVGFVAAARDYAHQLEPRLGVGATITYGGVERGWEYMDDLLAVSDGAVFTYYPLNDDFSVRDPAVAAADMARMVEAAGDLPVLFQEVGYPSGDLPTPGNDSSGEKQRQFIETFFAEVQQYPQVRFVSILQLSDWSDAVCDGFVQYYTDQDTLPQFHEYLCSLGLLEYDGTPKPAFDTFLTALQEITAGRDSE